MDDQLSPCALDSSKRFPKCSIFKFSILGTFLTCESYLTLVERFSIISMQLLRHSMTSRRRLHRRMFTLPLALSVTYRRRHWMQPGSTGNTMLKNHGPVFPIEKSLFSSEVLVGGIPSLWVVLALCRLYHNCTLERAQHLVQHLRRLGATVPVTLLVTFSRRTPPDVLCLPSYWLQRALS